MAAVALSARLSAPHCKLNGFTQCSSLRVGSSNLFLAPPSGLGYRVKSRNLHPVSMAGHGHGHEEKPKEPEFQPSGWYEKDIAEYRPKYTTAGEGEPFDFGIEDGHHTWHEGDDGEFWDEVKKALEESGAPTGIPGFIAASFLPILFGMIFLGIDDTFWLIFTAVWTVVYAGFQMAKPATYLNFEPDRYKMVYDPIETRPEPWSQELLEQT